MHKWHRNYFSDKGFVLPTVLIVSLIMMSALTLSLTVVWSSRQSLKEQFDVQNARNAAISGVNVADGCRYGNDIVISDTITAATSPLGTRDCGRTNATTSINPFILRSEYGSATSSFGFAANFIKDSSGVPVLITATGGTKGVSSGGFVKQGRSSIVGNGVYEPPLPNIQTITKSACPSTRTLTTDARDKNVYYIQLLADGNCWMLTSLSYAGGASNGGSNSFGDVINQGTGAPGSNTITNGTSDSVRTFTLAKYYIPPGSNPTIAPTPPSTATDGGVDAATRQFGYLYNWCAAMGTQNTAACAQATAPAPDPSINICPAGWRLPTGVGATGEFRVMNNTVYAGKMDSDSSIIGLPGLFQRGGGWGLGGSFFSQGTDGSYWSSSQNNDTQARYLGFFSTTVDPAFLGTKNYGFAVRCIAI